MTQPKLLIDQVVISYELPVDAENIRIMKFSQPETLSYDYSITRGDKTTTGLIAMIDLPAGTWEIICASKECTEEQAKGVVEEYSIRGHKRFEDYSREFMWQETALDSLRSLLTLKGLDPNKNYIILKKIA